MILICPSQCSKWFGQSITPRPPTKKCLRMKSWSCRDCQIVRRISSLSVKTCKTSIVCKMLVRRIMSTFRTTSTSRRISDLLFCTATFLFRLFHLHKRACTGRGADHRICVVHRCPIFAHRTWIVSFCTLPLMAIVAPAIVGWYVLTTRLRMMFSRTAAEDASCVVRHVGNVVWDADGREVRIAITWMMRLLWFM